MRCKLPVPPRLTAGSVPHLPVNTPRERLAGTCPSSEPCLTPWVTPEQEGRRRGPRRLHPAASQLESQHLPQPSDPRPAPPWARAQASPAICFPKAHREPRETRESNAQRICATCQSTPRTGQARGPEVRAAGAQTSGLCASGARQRGPAEGSCELPGPQARAPTLCGAPACTQSPALATLAFSAAACPSQPWCPGPRGSRAQAWPRRSPPARALIPAKLRRPLPQVPRGSHLPGASAQARLPAWRARPVHPARPPRTLALLPTPGSFSAPATCDGCWQPGSCEINKHQYHVEEIGLVPLAEELVPACAAAAATGHHLATRRGAHRRFWEARSRLGGAWAASGTHGEGVPPSRLRQPSSSACGTAVSGSAYGPGLIAQPRVHF